MSRGVFVLLWLIVLPVVVVTAAAVVLMLCVAMHIGPAYAFARSLVQNSNSVASDAALFVRFIQFVELPLILAIVVIVTSRLAHVQAGLIAAAAVAGIIAGYPSTVVSVVFVAVFVVGVLGLRVVLQRRLAPTQHFT